MTIATIHEVTAETFVQEVEALAEILHACVHADASVGFILPFSLAESRAFWREMIAPSLATGERLLLAARLDDKAVGTVQLVPAMMPNQPHRADVSKLLVHPNARRRGIAKLLMQALEGQAREMGRHLLTLDTRTGDKAEPLYRALGYTTAGIIPGYCLDPKEPRYDPTTYMYKAL